MLIVEELFLVKHQHAAFEQPWPGALVLGRIVQRARFSRARSAKNHGANLIEPEKMSYLV